MLVKESFKLKMIPRSFIDLTVCRRCVDKNNTIGIKIVLLVNVT